MESQTARHVSLLRNAGLKVTPARLSLLDLLTEHGRHMSADEIVQALQARGQGIDRVTVYRNLERLLEAGILVATHLPGRALRVGVCTKPNTEHHHHIVCEVCGRIEETDGCLVRDNWEDLSARMMSSTGFELTGHVMQYIGICPQCRRERARRSS